MPIEIKDLATHKGFLTKLKLEPVKAPVGEFVFYEKYPFPDGEKPLLLLGLTVPPAVKEHVKKQKCAIKASGTYQATHEGLEFVVQSGSFQSTHITSCGLKGKVKGEAAQVPETGGADKQVVTEAEQQGTEGEEATGEQVQPTKKTFQTATPKSEDKKKITTGDTREQVAQFVKQRDDLLKFSQKYLATMTNYQKQAQEAATMARTFIERADKGEANDHLASMLEDQLGFCQRLFKEATEANKTNGKEVVTGRQVNPSAFIKDLTLAKETADKYRHIFTQVAAITQQCTTAMADIGENLGEVMREMELVLPRARTGVADLKDLLAYLDKQIVVIHGAVDKLEKAYLVESLTLSLTKSLNDTKLSKEELQAALSGSQESLDSRKRAVAEVFPRIQLLVKSAFSRMQQDVTKPEIQTRYATIKEAIGKATTMKREFDQGCKAFDGVAAQIDARIKS